MDIAKIRKKLKSSEQELKARKQQDSLTEDLSSVIQKEDISSGRPETPETQRSGPLPQRQEIFKSEEQERGHEGIQETELAVESSQYAQSVVITEQSQETSSSSVGTYEPEPQVKESAPINLLVFKLGGEEYAFILEDVREILKKQYITKVPLAPYSVIGITSLRGTVIPVIDLSMKLLGIPSRRNRTSRILIMEGQDGLIGCMVDEIEGVLRSREDQKKALPENMTDKEKVFIDAIFVIEQRFITLLKKDVIEISEKGGQRSDVSYR